MARERKKIYQSEYPQNPPEWYWVKGLHDACIVGVETIEFSFDYEKYTEQKNEYTRNALIFKVDSNGAMFDFHVKEIRFYNYKILSKEVDLTGRKKIWWLEDKLTEENGNYILEITLEDTDPTPEQFSFKVKFERAEVDRT